MPAGTEYQFTGIDFKGQKYFSLLNYEKLDQGCLLYLDYIRDLMYVGGVFNITEHTKTKSGK